MFGSLKDKLKGVLGNFSKQVEEEAEDVIDETEEILEESPVIKDPVEHKTEDLEVKEVIEDTLFVEDPLADVLKEEPDEEIQIKVEDEDNSKDLVDGEVMDFEDEEKSANGITDEVLSDSDDLISDIPDEVINPTDPVGKLEKKEVEILEEATEIVEEAKALEEIKGDVLPERLEEIEAFVEEKEKELEVERKDLEKKVEVIEDTKEKSKKGFFSKIFSKSAKEEALFEDDAYDEKPEIVEEPKVEEEAVLEVKSPDVKEEPEVVQELKEEEPKEEEPEVVKDSEAVDELKDEETVEDKKSFFGKVKSALTKKVSDEKFEELFWDIELVLLENNISLEVVEKIKEDLKESIVGKPISKSNVSEKIMSSLRASFESLFEVEGIDLLDVISSKKPYVISFIGVNGSGKTTQLAKVAKMFKDNNKSCVIAACDTFRAAAIQQLEEHANNLDIKIIKHDYGADAAAVAFDAIEHAKSKGIDVVLIDTAGRLHSNENLMNELSKLMRIASPDFNLFVGESITGNDCVEQATKFGESVRLDGIILTKADVDDKGGAAISISYVTGKPIMFLGTGQGYDDLKKFDKEIILENIGL